MSLSLYEVSVPVFLRGLRNLADLLDKAVAHAADKGVDPTILVQARLAPDMYTLAGQVQSASDAAKSGSARLAGLPVPSFPDVETTLEELQERIAKTIAFVESASADAINSREDQQVELKIGGAPIKFASHDYLLNFVLPNFFFHVTTAYDILRQQGLAIGKRDYLGSR